MAPVNPNVRSHYFRRGYLIYVFLKIDGEAMDFVDWFGVVLNKLIETYRNYEHSWHAGLRIDMLAKALLPSSIADISFLSATTHGKALIIAIYEMKSLGLIHYKDKMGQVYEIPLSTHDLAVDLIPLWESTCNTKLTTQEEALLKAINRHSENVAVDHAWLESVGRKDIVSEVGWADEGSLWAIGKALEQRKFVQSTPYGGPEAGFRAAYLGLVWETRRGFTIESKLIDRLVLEWETTSVDFKRELYIDTADQKAELIKDIIGLANTQASGRRWLVIGFDDKTRCYFGPPDSKLTQNRLEQVLSQYTDAVISIKYDVVDYRAGKVGKIEVLRDPKKVPYRVSKSIGDKKRILQNQIFVRHGSQTEVPTADELKALQDEGNRARNLL